MRILVHEFFSGGGLAGRSLPGPLLREGAAMREALVGDLAELLEHKITATVDERVPLHAPPAVKAVKLSDDAQLDALMEAADAVWLIAPETGGCLEALAARAEALGTALLGCGSAAVRAVADKAALARVLNEHGLPHPKTRAADERDDPRSMLEAVGCPVVIKPARGAGCEGVGLVWGARDLLPAWKQALAAGDGQVIVQRWLQGSSASVSLLCAGSGAQVLAVNAQHVNGSACFSYHGGITPFEHPQAARAAEVARQACVVLPGLRGHVGVDVLLTDSEAFVIEINPRLTTSYLGVRAALDANIADRVIEACEGRLSPEPRVRRRVDFCADGTVTTRNSDP